MIKFKIFSRYKPSVFNNWQVVKREKKKISQFGTIFGILTFHSAQCGKFRIFMSLRFYVKSILVEVEKYAFLQIVEL